MLQSLAHPHLKQLVKAVLSMSIILKTHGDTIVLAY